MRESFQLMEGDHGFPFGTLLLEDKLLLRGEGECGITNLLIKSSLLWLFCLYEVSQWVTNDLKTVNMVCYGVLNPKKKTPQKTVTPPSSKIIYLPQSSNFLLPPPTGNKKHEDVKLIHKPFIQHNCEQIKKKTKWNLKKYNKPNIHLTI